MPLSRQKIKGLKIGSVYKIAHERKGHFVGKLIRVEEMPEGDKEDDVTLVFKYDVRTGTEQERLKVTGSQLPRVSGLRPSLIIDIQHAGDGDEWWRDVVVPEEKEVGEPNILKRLFRGGKR